MKRLLAAIALSMSLNCFAATPVAELVAHYRFEPAERSKSTVALAWGDSITFVAEVPPIIDSDYLTGTVFSYRYLKGDSVLVQGQADVDYSRNKGFSLLLRATPTGAVAEAGGESATATVEVDYDCGRDSVTVINPNELKVLRSSVFSLPVPKRETADYDGTTGPLAGVWCYLDRENDRRVSVPGGFYTIAVIPESDGTFAITCLDGVQKLAEQWPADRVKGRLTPNGFVNHYNLMWLDAYGRSTGSENYADLNTENGILTLTFPLLKAVLRFQKIR